jgi:hypothetical protein
MIISHTHKLIFIKTKKTAGTSIEVFLGQHLGDRDIVTPVTPEEATSGHQPRNYRGRFWPLGEAAGLLGAAASWKEIDGGGAIKSLGHVVKGKRFYNHIPAYRVAHRVPKRVWDSYFKVAVERNPWDKAISQFYWKARRRENYNFRDFVSERDVGVNWPRYCHPRTGALMVDRILYYDRLNEELGALFAELGIPFSGSLDVRAKGQTRKARKPYQELFTGELAPYREAVEELFAHEIALHGWDFETGRAAGAALGRDTSAAPGDPQEGAGGHD